MADDAQRDIHTHHQEKIFVEDVPSKSHDPEHIEYATATVEITDYTPKEVSRILWKVDIRLLPMLSFFYLLAFLDRGNSKCSRPSIACNYLIVFSWQCKGSRNATRSGSLGNAIQSRVDNVLHSVRSSRSALQHCGEDHQATHLDCCHDVHLGHLHVCARLSRSLTI